MFAGIARNVGIFMTWKILEMASQNVIDGALEQTVLKPIKSGRT
jgi:hypothetical protein